MAGLTGKKISSSYKSLLRMNDDTHGISAGLTNVTDGEGTQSALNLCDDLVEIKPIDDNTIGTLTVRNAGDDIILKVDTSNSLVKVNSGQEIANTQYAYFGANNIDTADFTVNTHMPIPFNSQGYGDLGEIPAFATDTDPALLFTTAEGNTTRASDLVPCIWFVPDNITIDNIYAFVGADTATTDSATRIHLVQYTFTSGSTSALTSGETIAHSTSDTSNLGSEQIYKTTLSKDVTDIEANQVILAFFRSDSINSDYSINITVKYHLR